MYPQLFRLGLTETDEISSVFSTFCHSSLPPSWSCRAWQGDTSCNWFKILSDKTDKRVIYYPRRPRPASPLSPLSSPRLSSTHLWRSPVKRKLWGRHGALCTAGLAPLLWGRGPGLIGGSTRESSNRQTTQPGGPFASMWSLLNRGESQRRRRRRRSGDAGGSRGHGRSDSHERCGW